MKNAKKFFSVLFVLILTGAVIAGCSGTKNEAQGKETQGSSQETSESSKNTMKSFSIWTWLGGVEDWGGKSYDEVLAYQEMEKRTGVKVKYVHPTGDAVESFNLMMTSGKMEDTIWYPWSPERQAQYSSAGRIIDIYPMVKAYAPNLMALMEANPNLKKQLVDPQGKMYYMPWITQDQFLNLGEGLVLREDWLNKVGKGIPKTNQELYDTLKAMKDLKVSGDKPFVGITGYPGGMSKLFYGFGVADDWYLEGKQVTYGPTSPKYKEALKWFNKMYSEGLIDKDYLTGEEDIYHKHFIDNQAAGFIDNLDQAYRTMKMSADAGNPFKFVGIPYLQYNGVSVSLNSTAKRIAQPYGLAVTSTAKDPEQIVKYLDYGYGEAGQTLFNWGIEGDTFTTKDGKRAFTDKIMKPKDNVPGVELTKYTNANWLTVSDPNATKALLDDRGVEIRDTWAKVDLSMAIEPTLYMTKSELDTVKSTSTDIDTYKNEMRDSFITGKKNIDSEWDAYVKTIESMGIEKIQQAKQAAYDRFMKE